MIYFKLNNNFHRILIYEEIVEKAKQVPDNQNWRGKLYIVNKILIYFMIYALWTL